MHTKLGLGMGGGIPIYTYKYIARSLCSPNEVLQLLFLLEPNAHSHHGIIIRSIPGMHLLICTPPRSNALYGIGPDHSHASRAQFTLLKVVPYPDCLSRISAGWSENHPGKLMHDPCEIPHLRSRTVNSPVLVGEERSRSLAVLVDPG
jgi:hypothetical protein